MTELYDVLYSVPVDEVESGDLIRFTWTDDENVSYQEVVEVSEVDFEGTYVAVSGFSHVLNDRDTYYVPEEQMVAVLGG